MKKRERFQVMPVTLPANEAGHQKGITLSVDVPMKNSSGWQKSDALNVIHNAGVEVSGTIRSDAALRPEARRNQSDYSMYPLGSSMGYTKLSGSFSEKKYE